MLSYRRLCRCRCATHTTQWKPERGFGEVNKLYVVCAKCEAYYIVRYSSSWMNSGKTLTCRDAQALKNMSALASQPFIHRSSQPYILPFLQSSIPLIKHPYPKPANSTKKKASSLCRSCDRISKLILTNPHGTSLSFIQNSHKHTLINMKSKNWVTIDNAGVVPTVLTSAKNREYFTEWENKHGGQKRFTPLGLLSKWQTRQTGLSADYSLIFCTADYIQSRYKDTKRHAPLEADTMREQNSIHKCIAFCRALPSGLSF